jgi:hypothetical protein
MYLHGIPSKQAKNVPCSATKGSKKLYIHHKTAKFVETPAADSRD